MQKAVQYRVYHKAISRICSDKADRSSAFIIEMIYSICIWKTCKISQELVQLTGRRANLTVCTCAEGVL